jgi:hypothetical protein
MKRRATYQSTRPAHYFEPRYTPLQWQPTTWLRRNGEAIAMGLGLAVIVIAVGLTIWAVIVLP